MFCLENKLFSTITYFKSFYGSHNQVIFIISWPVSSDQKIGNFWTVYAAFVYYVLDCLTAFLMRKAIDWLKR